MVFFCVIETKIHRYDYDNILVYFFRLSHCNDKEKNIFISLYLQKHLTASLRVAMQFFFPLPKFPFVCIFDTYALTILRYKTGYNLFVFNLSYEKISKQLFLN